MDTNRKVILAVDDSSANLQLCKGLLSSEYDVRLAKSGTMALAALERIHADIVLLDIEMPDMTGFEVINKMKENLKLRKIPVIFVTSHASSMLAAQAMEHGAVDYIEKPYVSDVLFSKIESVLKNEQIA